MLLILTNLVVRAVYYTGHVPVLGVREGHRDDQRARL